MAPSKLGLTASTKTIDPTLDALFASSTGPVKGPSKTRYSELLPLKERKPLQKRQDTQLDGDEDEDEDEDEEGDDNNSQVDDESLSELGDGEIEEGLEGRDLSSNDEESEASEPTETLPEPQKKERKRKRKDEHDDLEDKYMRKLAEETEKEIRSDKRRKGEAGQAINGTSTEAKDSDEDEAPLVHESLLEKSEGHGDVELDKANRTLFLSNISVEAITSSKAKKLLMSHLSSPLSTLDPATGPHKVESIRFRSTAYSTGAMPKRAAFITKSVMSATTKSTNAYVVYSTPLAARTAVKELNGTIVLERHMKADSVAHPTPVDHRRCVFVGNLGFVDDETVVNTTVEGETTTKKRTKVPADVEEGLWRVFNQHAGKVESVRVPRDPKTRVGKGFAYVQFYDGNHVESALLLEGKKFPPMLPRALRVSRAKDPRKTALAVERTVKAKLEGANENDKKSKSTKHKPKITSEQLSQAGRAGKLLGRAAAARQRSGFKGSQSRHFKAREETITGEGFKTPEQIVFEGRRASQKDGRPKDMKFGKVRGKKGVVKAKTKSRGARRAAEWRKKDSK
ncbi:uncharacterized protein F4822DRAFT_324579 [Hypoxylon trugodes]|uniref:uncharacterized protein n=1 Tax=Hypoxylon trugodes TaxID=326681 RepID=UPI00219B154C|nr:uncharacterized protein F4822DRAFT_324579 [Hypoxylon trugodes]KAI1386701.1 hypothetical protein F4822DRAFT_324579 [Hypoxylon trugodes]